MNDDAQEVIGELLVSGKEKQAKFLADHIEVNTGSLKRIYHHLKHEEIPSWGIVTSYRDYKSPQENKADFQQLKSDVRSLEFGFFVLEGQGLEEDSEGNVRSVVEQSLFIPGISLNAIQHISDSYNQSGFVYSGPETRNDITLISKEGKQKLGSFQPMKIAQFYSKIKGKPFVFASVEACLWKEPAKSNTERLWRKRQGYNNDNIQDA